MSAAKSEQDIFLAALELGTPAERAAYLKGACGTDATLLAAVQKLLAVHENGDDFLDRPVLEPTGAFRPITEGPGTVIGPYKLLQQIGEGGFGVVYMAQQEKPVRRMVAVKIIKPGMDTALVIARFESERQALALMDHPNIAKVLDAGTTHPPLAPVPGGEGPGVRGSGRPYFVMELVKGVPVTEFCDKNHMPTAGRLKLFLDVCHAIQHAHHKGVIHRDIKPSNVMITLHDGVPVVKVIDFGVAKATVQKLTERTLFTAYGQMIGTPAYMSPEQAEMSGLDIDTRSDIYSLGVLLYELLTGTTPLESKRLREAGFAEMQRLIREEEAPRPSTRLSSLGDSATLLAGNRGTDPKQLARLLAGDLDWIVMKALDKDRNRRYGSPGELAADVERYLRHDAILARPPSATYRLRKFARRNRAAVATAAAVAAALIIGTAVATWQAVVATRARAELADEQAKVEARFELAQKAIALFHTGISEDMLLKNAEFKDLRTKLLKEAKGFYEDLEKLLAGQTDAKSRKALAAGYFQLGELTEKIGDQKDALAIHRKALALRRELAAAEGPDMETRLDVARSLRMVARMLSFTGDTAGALRELQEMEELTAGLQAESPADAVRQQLAQSHTSIGFVLGRTGKPTEALEAYRKGLAIWQKLADANPANNQFWQSVADSHNGIGTMVGQTGKPAEALEEYRKAVAIFQKLADANPAVSTFQSDLAGNLHNMAIVQARMGKTGEALKTFEKAVAIQQVLVEANPAVTQFQRFLANHLEGTGLLLSRTGKSAEALQEWHKALAIRQKLADANPTLTESQSAVARSHNNMGSVLVTMGKPAEALKEHQNALAIRQKLAEANPAVTEFQSDLAQSDDNIGLALSRMGKHSEALTAHQKALAIWQKLADANPAVTDFQSDLAFEHNVIGALLNDRLSKHAEALAAFRQSLTILQTLVKAHPAVTAYQKDLAIAQNNIGEVLSQTGKPAEALQEYQKSLAIMQKLVDDNPADTGYQLVLANFQTNIGQALDRQKRLPEALTAQDISVTLNQKLAQAEPANADYSRALGSSHAVRGGARVRAGQPAEAAADLRRAVELWAKDPNLEIDIGVDRWRALANLAALGGHANSGVTMDEAKTFADQAVAALAAGVQTGWADPGELKQPDYDALRGRADFQKLVAEVEAKAEKMPETAATPAEKK